MNDHGPRAYARVLYVGATPQGEADYVYRLQETIKRAGHGLMRIEPDCPFDRAPFVPQEKLHAALLRFNPTVLIWDEQTVPFGETYFGEHIRTLLEDASFLLVSFRHEEGTPLASVFDGVLQTVPKIHNEAATPHQGMHADDDMSRPTITCAPDRAYRHARTSFFPQKRSGVLYPNGIAGGYEDAVFAFVGDAAFKELSPYGINPGYQVRTALASVFFAQPRACDLTSVCMRIAEGSLVIAEQGFCEGSSAHADLLAAIPTFTRDTFTSVVESLLFDPEQAETMRSCQQRALDGMRYLDDDINEMLDACDELARALDKQPTLSCESPATEAVLYGWFGADNFGDDLLMTLLAEGISSRLDNAVIKILGANPGMLESKFGFEAPQMMDKLQAKRCLETASVMTFSGGLIFDQPMDTTAGDLEFMYNPYIEPSCQAALSLLGRMLDTPTVAIGIGVGPVDNPPTRHMLRLMGMSGARFLARDEHTAELLRLSKVDPTQITTTADLAFSGRDLYGSLLQRASVTLPDPFADKPYFIVSMRDFHLNPPDLFDRVTQAVDRIIEKTGLAVIFLPFDAGDVGPHRYIFEHLENKSRSLLIEEKPSIPDFIKLIADSRMAFAMRLHCSILHHVFGKPAVGINYNDKICSHFEEMGQIEYLVGLDEDAQFMADTTIRCYENRDEIIAKIRPVCERKARLVDASFDELISTMEKTRNEKLARFRGNSGNAGDDLNRGEDHVDSFDRSPDRPVAQNDALVFYPRTVSPHEIDEEHLRRQLAERQEPSLHGEHDEDHADNGANNTNPHPKGSGGVVRRALSRLFH